MRRSRGTWSKQVHKRLLDEGIQHGGQWKFVGVGLIMFFLLVVGYLLTMPSNNGKIDHYNGEQMDQIHVPMRQTDSDINLLLGNRGRKDPESNEPVNAHAQKQQQQEQQNLQQLQQQKEELKEELKKKQEQNVEEKQSEKEKSVQGANQVAKKEVKEEVIPIAEVKNDNAASIRNPQKEMEALQHVIESAPLVVVSKTWCPFCKTVKEVLIPFNKDGNTMIYIECDLRDDGDLIMNAIEDVTGRRSVPKVFLGGEFIGGLNEVRSLIEKSPFEAAVAKASADWHQRQKKGDIKIQ